MKMIEHGMEYIINTREERNYLTTLLNMKNLFSTNNKLQTPWEQYGKYDKERLEWTDNSSKNVLVLFP